MQKSMVSFGEGHGARERNRAPAMDGRDRGRRVPRVVVHGGAPAARVVQPAAGAARGRRARLGAPRREHREPVYNTVARHLRGVAPCGTGLIISGLAMADMLVEFDVEVVIPV